MESGNNDRCRCCGQRKDPAGQLGRGCGMIAVLLLFALMLTPLLWLTREALAWALGV